MLMLTVSRSLLLDLVLCTRVGSSVTPHARAPRRWSYRVLESHRLETRHAMKVRKWPSPVLPQPSVPMLSHPPSQAQFLHRKTHHHHQKRNGQTRLDDVSCFGTRTIAPAPIPAVAAHFSPLR